MNRFFLLFTPIILISAVDCAIADSAGDRLKVIVAARVEKLQNVDASYERTETYSPSKALLALPGQKATDGSSSIVLSGAFHYSDHLEALDHKYMYYEEILKDKPHMEGGQIISGPSRSIFIMTPERYEQLNYNEIDGKPLGSINPPKRLPENSFDYGIGLRLLNGDNFFTVAEIAAMESSKKGSLDLLQFRDTRKRLHIWEFDERMEFALTRYSVIDIATNSPIFIAEGSDFKNSDGLMLPAKIVERYFGSSKSETERVELAIARISLGLATNVPTLYRINWPLGALVRDNRNDQTINVDSAGMGLTDAELHERADHSREEQERLKREAQDRIDQTLKK